MRREFGDENGPFALALATHLTECDATRWFGWCVARYHKEAFALLDGATVESLAAGGFCGAATPTEYARVLAGPAWVAGKLEGGRVLRWARSADATWRVVAAICTVALNTKGDGGGGDVARTLRVLAQLVDDEDAAVRKATQKARRALAPHDR